MVFLLTIKASSHIVVQWSTRHIKIAWKLTAKTERWMLCNVLKTGLYKLKMKTSCFTVIPLVKSYRHALLPQRIDNPSTF